MYVFLLHLISGSSSAAEKHFAIYKDLNAEKKDSKHKDTVYFVFCKFEKELDCLQKVE